MGFVTTRLGGFAHLFSGKGWWGRSEFSAWPVLIQACSGDDNDQGPYLSQRTGTLRRPSWSAVSVWLSCDVQTYSEKANATLLKGMMLVAGFMAFAFYDC